MGWAAGPDACEPDWTRVCRGEPYPPMTTSLAALGCMVFGHKDLVVTLPDRLFLACAKCGRTTPGWSVARDRRPRESAGRSAPWCVAMPVAIEADKSVWPEPARSFARLQRWLRTPVVVIRREPTPRGTRVTIRFPAWTAPAAGARAADLLPRRT